MTEADIYYPPYAEKRMKLGFAIVEMSKQQENIVHFEANKLVKLVKP